jgi:hypothetical protein
MLNRQKALRARGIQAPTKQINAVRGSISEILRLNRTAAKPKSGTFLPENHERAKAIQPVWRRYHGRYGSIKPQEQRGTFG